MCLCSLMSVSVHISKQSTWGSLPPRWPGVRDDAAVCAWGQRSVSDRVWQQGLWANAPCWARTPRPCDCRTSRPGFHRATWEAICPHTAVDDTPPFKVVAHTANHCSSPTAYTIFHIHTHTHMFVENHRGHTHTHTPFLSTQLSHTTLSLFDPTPSPLSMLPFLAHHIFCFNLEMAFFTHIFNAQHCHTPSFTLIFVTQTLSFTHNFATHNSSHTTF